MLRQVINPELHKEEGIFTSRPRNRKATVKVLRPTACNSRDPACRRSKSGVHRYDQGDPRSHKSNDMPVKARKVPENTGE